MKKKLLNRNTIYIFSIGFYLFLSAIQSDAAFKDSGWGTRPAGMGGAFTAISDDATAPFYNAAGIAQIQRCEVNFMYAKLFTGLELYAGEESVDLGLNYGSFVFPLGSLGNFGLTWANFVTTNLYEEDTFTITYANQISKYFLWGLNLKYLNHSYTLDERTREDPVFADSYSKSNFTGDFGILIKAGGKKDTGLCIGLMAKNISEPDVGLDEEDIVPFEGRFGLAYQSKNFNPAVDITYRDKDLNFHVGLETWVNNRILGVRIGGNNRELTSGISFNSEALGKFGLQFDYAFIWPLEVEGSTCSHRASFTLRFGESPQEIEDARIREERRQDEEYKERQRKELAEEARRKAEQAEREAKWIKLEAEKVLKEAEQARQEAEQIQMETEKAKQETEQAWVEIEKARKLAEEQKALSDSILKMKELEMRKEGKKLIITVKAHFAFGKAEINVLDTPALEQVVEILKKYSKYKIRIEGYTDSIGDSEYNLKLSEERAKSVFYYLVSQSINAERLTYLGFGEANPIASNKTPIGRSKNRRVEFVILNMP